MNDLDQRITEMAREILRDRGLEIDADEWFSTLEGLRQGVALGQEMERERWQPIETLPPTGMFLLGIDDGSERVMIWEASIFHAKMTQEQHDKLMDACKPVPMIMLQCGSPTSQQENANCAWQALGEELGFKWDTVSPAMLRSELFFYAEPSE